MEKQLRGHTFKIFGQVGNEIKQLCPNEYILYIVVITLYYTMLYILQYCRNKLIYYKNK